MKIQEGTGSKADIALEFGLASPILLRGVGVEEIMDAVEKGGRNMKMKKLFKYSTGWLDRFKKRNNITWHKIAGESAAVPCGMVEQWLPKVHNVLEKYSPRDVYNADEMGLSYNLMPDCTIAAKRDLQGEEVQQRPPHCAAVRQHGWQR
ncbi:hypothetical protein PR048_005700 [Dryococelus australis]|uniref:HTH CENPB-type domain-containing protein n=1 Tax=Dryococelus australis TaxID=614101 RepID=A0ABQ9I8W5_9NEOP|nr:hypothetical protein PR048_005700 [Dryococelus australis]